MFPTSMKGDKWSKGPAYARNTVFCYVTYNKAVAFHKWHLKKGIFIHKDLCVVVPCFYHTYVKTSLQPNVFKNQKNANPPAVLLLSSFKLMEHLSSIVQYIYNYAIIS